MAARVDRAPSRLISQLVFGAGCALAMIVIRMVIDHWWPGAGPFALIYPTVLLATLYGRLPAGLLSFVVTFSWAWFVVLPGNNSFQSDNDTDQARVAVNAVSALIVILFAEVFRRAVERASIERDEEIRRRDLLMAELGHRTKNNFALVASLLALQRRQDARAEVQAILDTAIGRVHSFANAYEHLVDARGTQLQIDMASYLEGLCEALGAAFPDNVALECRADSVMMSKERAVAIGLVVNEALTNAAKYAFPEGRGGRVAVRFDTVSGGWVLTVTDDGVGRGNAGGDRMTGRDKPGGGGLGSDLMNVFARQADAELSIDNDGDGDGTRVMLFGKTD